MIIEVKDLNNPELEIFQSLRESQIPEKSFIVEGDKVLNYALEKRIPIEKIFLSHEKYNLFKNQISSIPFIYVAEKNLMHKIIGFRLHQGVIALATRPEALAINELRSPIIVWDRIHQGENAGSILRNMAAFGFNGLLIDKESCHPYLRRSVRVSMGSVFDCSYALVENLKDQLQVLKNQGFQIVALEQSKRSIPLSNFSRKSDKSVFILGNEGEGVSSEILDICDIHLHIPMSENFLKSLNVATSSGILLYHLAKKIH